MADSMIARVAKAILVSEGKDPDHVDGWKRPMWKAREKQARAAIEAMRELTEAEMIAAGPCMVEVTEAGSFSPTASFSAPIGKWWRAIIDSALKEPT